MNTGHVQYDQDSELSKSVKRKTSKLPTNQPENNKNFIVAGHIPDTSSILPGQQKYISSFVSQILKTHMGWLEHLCSIIYQHDASLLIVRHSY